MKLSEASLEQVRNWAAGKLTLSIGEGRFHEELYMVISLIVESVYERGHGDGLKDAARGVKQRNSTARDPKID